MEKCGPVISRNVVKPVVNACAICASIDPATRFGYTKGNLNSHEVWERLCLDVTNYRGPYLSVVDACSGYVIWKRLKTASAEELCQQMEEIFTEFGPPQSILT